MVGKVNKIIQRVNSELLKHQQGWIEDDIISSLEVINIIAELEDEFGVMIDPEDIVPENFNSLDDILNLIRKYVEND